MSKLEQDTFDYTESKCHSGTEQKCWEEQKKNSEINQLDFT
jgi:hypothetical protein